MVTRRRLTIALAAGALAAPFASFPQQQQKIYRIGVLALAPSPSLDAFLLGLREHDYVEGRNAVIERRFTRDDVGNARALAQELVALKVDVIFASSSTFV